MDKNERLHLAKCATASVEATQATSDGDTTADASSGWQLTDAHAGAIQFTRYVHDAQDQSAFDVHTLFDDGIVSDLRSKVRAAGFPMYPERSGRRERLAIAKNYTGAAPKIEDSKDLPASLAWILFEMSQSEWSLKHAMERGDLGAAWRQGIRMGRLAEFWRWRKEGHDRRAESGHALSSGGAVGHEMVHGTETKKNARWRRHAESYWREIANGTGKNAAYFVVAEKYGVSDRTIRRSVDWVKKNA